MSEATISKILLDFMKEVKSDVKEIKESIFVVSAKQVLCEQKLDNHIESHLKDENIVDKVNRLYIAIGALGTLIVALLAIIVNMFIGK